MEVHKHVQYGGTVLSARLPPHQEKVTAGKRARTRAVLKLCGALVCIFLSIVAWVTMAEKLQTLNKTYKKPYFITYFVHSCYSLIYVAWALWRYAPNCNLSIFCNSVGDGALDDFKRLGVWSGILSVLSLLTAYCWYLSLTRTNIPANTAIYQCTFAIVFVISVPLLKEKVTVLKVLCTLVAIAGVFLVAFYSNVQDVCVPDNITNSTNVSNNVFDYGTAPPGCKGSDLEQSTPLGYILLAVSILLYAILETFYKKFATKKDDVAFVFNGIRFLGYIGVHNLLWLWPPIIILHYTNVEPFELPPSMEIFWLMVLNGMLDVVFNGCLFVCIALSSPLFYTVGTILTIPVSVVIDWLVQHFLLPAEAFIGIALILVGFIGFVVSEFVHVHRESKHNHQEKLKVLIGSDIEKTPSSDEQQSLLPKEMNESWRSKLFSYLI